MSASVRLTTNSVLRFGLELTALTVLGIYGWHAVDAEPQRLLATIALPLAGAVVWGLFVAPRSPRFLTGPGRLGVEALVFGSAAVALLALGRPLFAVVWTGLAAANTALVHLWKQDVAARESVEITGPRAA